MNELIQEYIKWFPENTGVFVIVGVVLNSLVIYSFFLGNFFEKPIWDKFTHKINKFEKVIALILINLLIFGVHFFVFYNEEISSKEMEIENITFQIPKEYKNMGVIEGSGGYEESWSAIIVNEKEVAGIYMFVYERKASITFSDFVTCTNSFEGIEYSDINWKEEVTSKYRLYNSVTSNIETEQSTGKYIYQSNLNDQYIIMFYYFGEKGIFDSVEKDVQMVINTVSINPKEYDYDNAAFLQFGMDKAKVKDLLKPIGIPQIYSYSELMEKAYNTELQPYGSYKIIEKEDKRIETWEYIYDGIVIMLQFDNKNRLKSYMFAVQDQYVLCLERLIEKYGEPTESYINNEILEFNTIDKEKYNELLGRKCHILHRWILDDCNIVFKSNCFEEKTSSTYEIFSTITFDEWEKMVF